MSQDCAAQLAQIDAILQQLERASHHADKALLDSLSDMLDAFSHEQIETEDERTREDLRTRCEALRGDRAGTLDVNLLDRDTRELQQIIDLAGQQV